MLSKDEVLRKVRTDVDFIPSLEEYKLIKDIQFSYGSAPVFKLTLSSKRDMKLIEDIEKETKDNRPSGLYELYCQLESDGYCESYNLDRIYYIAYTLAAKNILFNIDGIEYRDKLNKKREALIKLEKQSKR